MPRLIRDPDDVSAMMRSMFGVSREDIERGRRRLLALLRKRQHKPSLARLVAKAKQLGVDVTIESNGAATFHCSPAASDLVINEWNEVLPRHGTH